MSRRSIRRESYPDLAPPVKDAVFADPSEWPDWTDAETFELGRPPSGVDWPELIQGDRYTTDTPRGEGVRRG